MAIVICLKQGITESETFDFSCLKAGGRGHLDFLNAVDNDFTDLRKISSFVLKSKCFYL